MEDIDIESLNFDKYNREVYLYEPYKKDKPKHHFDNSQTFDPQKRYKIEINKLIAKMKKEEKHEFEDTSLASERKKKKKL